MPEVLIVSKPIAPPFRDGTKCLVRDVATNLERVSPVVMSVKGAPPLAPAAGAQLPRLEPVYAKEREFAPGFLQNARPAVWLLSSRGYRLWHFVFAPNPRTSAIGRILSRLKGARVIQTIASPPRSFVGIERLLFGEIVVAQSGFTKARVAARYRELGLSPPRIEVIPPPVGELGPFATEITQRVRRQFGIPSKAPVVVYPGDLETSSGAEATAELVAPLRRALPDSIVVFAYRAKTPKAFEVERALKRRLPEDAVRFISQIDNVLHLIATCTAVVFPVDDVTGKVDLPIVLLEAMALGVPVIAYDYGPLAELTGARFVECADGPGLLSATLEVARAKDVRDGIIAAQKRSVLERHGARVVARAYEHLYEELLR